MSITIKHLSGPLKGRTQEFNGAAGAILIGRAPGAQVVYPEECIEVNNEHLTLNRDDTGGYRVDLCGSGDVEIDGKPAETGSPVTSGSIVTVGSGGPCFEVLLPGLTIKHLDGPLAGQRQYFPPDANTIMFGRSREEAQVVYPSSFTSIGVRHFELKRTPAGDYHIELFGKRYVAMDGHPVINGEVVKSGAVFRLGALDGPTFMAEMVAEVRDYGKTAEQPEMPDVGGWLRGLSVRAMAGIGILGVLVAGVIGHNVYQHLQYRWVRDHVLGSVYLVVRKNPTGDTAEATAFVVGPHQFATNAHVTEAIRGKIKAFYLLGPSGDKIAITGVESHPGYVAFKAKSRTYAKAGSTNTGNFESVALPSAYDVGIITVDSAVSLPPPLELVTAEDALKLKVGDDVMTAGFPSEKIRGADNLVKGLAAATFRKGTIESLKDIFFSKSSDDPQNLLLVQHGIPVTGGMSGSPLVDSSGKVVAVISGGNTRALPGAAPAKTADAASSDPESLQTAKPERITDSAQVNFGQRADLLGDLMQGTASASLAADQSYWEKVCGTCPRYFDLALAEFTSGGVGAGQQGREIAFGYGVLTPGETMDAMSWAPGSPEETTRAQTVPASEAIFKASKSRKWAANTYSFEAEPGFAYGFIVDTTDVLPSELESQVSIRTKQEAPVVTELQPADGPKLPLALTVTVPAKTRLEVMVGGLLQAPVRYTLYAYRWALPPASSTDEPAAQGTDAAATLPQP